MKCFFRVVYIMLNCLIKGTAFSEDSTKIFKFVANVYFVISGFEF